MSKEITEEELHELTYKAVDELYEYYEVQHSFGMCLYLRFNGDAEDPGDLLTKEQFIEQQISKEPWNTAYSSLFQYIVKEHKKLN